MTDNAQHRLAVSPRAVSVSPAVAVLQVRHEPKAGGGALELVVTVQPDSTVLQAKRYARLLLLSDDRVEEVLFRQVESALRGLALTWDDL